MGLSESRATRVGGEVTKKKGEAYCFSPLMERKDILWHQKAKEWVNHGLYTVYFSVKPKRY